MLLLLVLILIGFALRVHGLAEPSLWVDEAQSAWISQQPLGLIIPLLIRADAHPPLYHLLLHAWTALTGTSELALRYFSVFWGTLTLPLLWVAGRWVAGRRVGLLAASLGTFFPLLVVYSQEARPYSLLGALAALAMIGLARLWRLPQRPSPSVSLTLGPPLAAAYVHYFGLAMLGGYGVAALLTVWVKRAPAHVRRRLLTATGAQIMALLPLALYLAAQFGNLRDFGTRSEASASLGDLVRLLWGFFALGDVNLLRSDLQLASLANYWALVLGLSVIPIAFGRTWHHLVLPILLVGLVVVPVSLYSRLVPGSLLHPRYLFWLGIPLILAAATIALVEGPLRRARSTAILLVFVVIAFMTLTPRLSDPARGRDQTRDVARFLTVQSRATDLVLTSWPVDRALDYYYDGAAPLRYVAFAPADPAPATNSDWPSPAGQLWPGDTAFSAWLRRTVEPGDHVFLVSWVASFRGGEAIEYVLEAHGRLIERKGFHGYTVDRYLIEPGESRSLTPNGPLQAGPLTWTGGRAGAVAGEGQPLTLALDWRPAAPPGELLRIAVTLIDAEGHALVRHDQTLRDVRGLTTIHWQPGRSYTSYHVMPLPKGSPPGRYRLLLEVYRSATLEPVETHDPAGRVLGRHLELGAVELARPVPNPHVTAPEPAGPPLRLVDGPLPGGVRLISFATFDASLVSGGVLRLLLHWELAQPAAAMPPRFFEYVLRREGRELARWELPTPFQGGGWRLGDTTLQFLDLRLPASLTPGPGSLELEAGQASLELTDLSLASAGRTFEPPPVEHAASAAFGQVARLVGYDLEWQPEGLRVVLYWQAVNREPVAADLHVFVHLIGEEGHILTQHDGPPSEGSAPTSQWVKGEFVRDPHLLPWLEEAPARWGLRLGLYDPRTMVRLPLAQGGDAFTVWKKQS